MALGGGGELGEQQHILEILGEGGGVQTFWRGGPKNWGGGIFYLKHV